MKTIFLIGAGFNRYLYDFEILWDYYTYEWTLPRRGSYRKQLHMGRLVLSFTRSYR